MRHALLIAAVTAFAAWGAPSLAPAGAAWAQEAATEEAAPATEEAAPAAGETAAPEESASSDNAATEEAAAEQPAAVQDMAQGAEDAPVTVIEYGSFTCPHCATWHAESYPQLKADYIDTGRVRFVFREVYFDRPGLWASMIARCGGQMRFFGIHDMIYEQQREWIGDGQPATIADNLRRIGLSAGLDQAQLDACLADAAQAEALVAWFQANAEADAIEGTPTFFINGEKQSNMPWPEMQALIDAELAEAGQ
jgi:protein-disulfide isomerase